MAREVVQGPAPRSPARPGVAPREQVTPELDRAHDFDTFVAAVSPRLARTAYLLTGNPHDAEELVQESLMRAWTRWDLVSAAGSPTAYVHRILVSRSVSRWRAVRRRLALESLTSEAPEPRDGPVVEARDDELWELVLTLPPRQRAVMVLTYYEDLADDEIARVLTCSVGTVKSQRAKSLRSLRSRATTTTAAEEQP